MNQKNTNKQAPEEQSGFEMPDLLMNGLKSAFSMGNNLEMPKGLEKKPQPIKKQKKKSTNSIG